VVKPVCRLVLLSALLLGVDQLTKTVAQLTFETTDLATWDACRDAGLNCGLRAAGARRGVPLVPA
jgi:hypothetical protein